MCNLIIRNKDGRVVDYLPGRGDEVEKFRFVSQIEEGMYPEATNDVYVKKWDKWWITS